LSTTAQLLASLNVPAGSYTQARVTFGDHFTLVAKDGTTSSVAVVSSVGTVANGLAVITITTPTKVLANQTATLLGEFKLADFERVGGALRPTVACGDGGQFGTRGRTAHVSGTVANLTATGFDLTGANGRTVTVTIASSTTITSGQTGAAV